jgi:putative hemolysin
MTRFLTLCLLAAPFALAGCGSSYEVVRMPGGKMRASSATEAGAYCAKEGGRARMLGMAPGNIEVMFECVKN